MKCPYCKKENETTYCICDNGCGTFTCISCKCDWHYVKTSVYAKSVKGHAPNCGESDEENDVIPETELFDKYTRKFKIRE